ncbi:unnamed protein product [Pelagomonas calceolata]|uniref:BspA family leucine-rich repeat surface protein n=2 Tax=Pelagomonas calceolata TaxID=35677 RepID=A0A8J2SWF1_9STRA|nr:unnamed protein product [Pelagomonas calceolata]
MNMRACAWCLLTCLAAADTGRRLGFVMDDSNIRTAVDAWLSCPTCAEYSYGHISTWDTSGVTDMSYLFCAWSGCSIYNAAAASFNEDIGAWDTSGVTTMRHMFLDASAFDQDIGGWAVHSVKDMRNVFYGASSFDQDLGWCLDEDVELSNDYLINTFLGTPCESTSCGVGVIGYSRCPDLDGDGVVDAAPEGECCISAYGQPFTDACGTTLTEVETSGCCPDDFLLRYSHDIYEMGMADFTRWDCVSFVDKEACDLKGPPYTWGSGSCWGSRYEQAAATCKTCTEDNGFDVRACRGLFLQEAKGKWNDWYYNPGMNPYCHEHSCCAQDPNDCCESNPAAVAGAVIVGLAVLAGLIKLYYKRCRKAAIAEPSTPPPKAQPEAASPKEEGATAVAPEAEESPQETLTGEAPPPAPPAKSWFWRGEPVPEPVWEAEETLAEQPPAPPAPEGEAESAPFAPETEERPPPPAKGWFSRAAPEPEPEFEPEPEA